MGLLKFYCGSSCSRLMECLGPGARTGVVSKILLWVFLFSSHANASRMLSGPLVDASITFAYAAQSAHPRKHRTGYS